MRPHACPIRLALPVSLASRPFTANKVEPIPNPKLLCGSNLRCWMQSPKNLQQDTVNNWLTLELNAKTLCKPLPGDYTIVLYTCVPCPLLSEFIGILTFDSSSCSSSQVYQNYLGFGHGGFSDYLSNKTSGVWECRFQRLLIKQNIRLRPRTDLAFILEILPNVVLSD